MKMICIMFESRNGWMKFAGTMSTMVSRIETLAPDPSTAAADSPAAPWTGAMSEGSPGWSSAKMLPPTRIAMNVVVM